MPFTFLAWRVPWRPSVFFQTKYKYSHAPWRARAAAASHYSTQQVEKHAYSNCSLSKRDLHSSSAAHSCTSQLLLWPRAANNCAPIAHVMWFQLPSLPFREALGSLTSQLSTPRSIGAAWAACITAGYICVCATLKPIQHTSGQAIPI